ncbi:hypothetical protein QYE76_044758 [Lolium multiflorum]|uniref:Uncharacterized protein n=1 Tax=Lolium multiflorum TaxID=4521 RepID=A0AAD8WX19_LOLMU|nr:hypothetical protein QYE76_044758 [Lolium multiflorum]
MADSGTQVSTVAAGTVGYVTPEYGQTWRATVKGDTYSYDVLMSPDACHRERGLARDGEGGLARQQEGHDGSTRSAFF